ncbi:MAG: transposase, partial [Chloroflexi bacterium]|nr:transposase [Chloroflexota bacterium]
NAYRALITEVLDEFGWTLELVSKLAGQVGFVLLPKRWIVERTFAWLGKYRRLARDYEYWPASSESLILLASIHRLLKRLAPATAT